MLLQNNESRKFLRSLTGANWHRPDPCQSPKRVHGGGGVERAVGERPSERRKRQLHVAAVAAIAVVVVLVVVAAVVVAVVLFR